MTFSFFIACFDPQDGVYLFSINLESRKLHQELSFLKWKFCIKSLKLFSMQKRDWVFFFIVFLLGFLVFTMKSFADDFGITPSERCDGLWQTSVPLSSTAKVDSILLREEWIRTYANSLRRFEKGEYILVHFHRKNFDQGRGDQKNYFYHEGYYYYWGTEIHDQKVVHLISKEGRDQSIFVPVNDVELSPYPLEQDLTLRDSKADALFEKSLNALLKKARLEAEDSRFKLQILTDTRMDFHHLDHAFTLAQNFLKKAKSWGFSLGKIQILYKNEWVKNIPQMGPFVHRSRTDALSAFVIMQKMDAFEDLPYTDSVLLHELVHAIMGFTFQNSTLVRFRTLDEAFADFLSVHFLENAQSISSLRNLYSGISIDIPKGSKKLTWRSITRVRDLKAGRPHDNSVLYSRLLLKIREKMGSQFIDEILPGLLKKIVKLEKTKSWKNFSYVNIPSTLGIEMMMFHFFLAALRWEMESHPRAKEALSFFQEKVQEMEADSDILQTSYQDLIKHQ